MASFVVFFRCCSNRPTISYVCPPVFSNGGTSTGIRQAALDRVWSLEDAIACSGTRHNPNTKHQAYNLGELFLNSFAQSSVFSIQPRSYIIMNKDDNEQQGGPGIRFGVDTTANAYAGEVGYDAGAQIEYDTEIGLDDDEAQEEDQGRMEASHPSTIQRQMVSLIIFRSTRLCTLECGSYE